MTRYIAKFARAGFPELYEVLDTQERIIISEPKTYHEANDEADQRNKEHVSQTPKTTPIACMMAG